MASFIYFVETLVRVGRRTSREEVERDPGRKEGKWSKFRDDRELQKESVIICSSNRVGPLNFITI